MADRYRNTPINQIPADVPVNIPLATDYQFPSYEMMTNSILPPIGVDPLASRSLSARSMPEINPPMWMVPFLAAAGMGGRRGGNKPRNEVSELVQSHNRRGATSYSPVQRNIDPPRMPVTRENLIPMMDRHGLSLTNEVNFPGRTQYYTFADRQGFLPLMRRDEMGRLGNVPNPRYVVRIPSPGDVHPAAPSTVFGRQADRQSAKFGRFFDTAYAPGTIPDRQTGEIIRPDRRLALDRFGRTLGDIRNLEGELVNRHFPQYRRPARTSVPRERTNPNQMSFLRALLGE